MRKLTLWYHKHGTESNVATFAYAKYRPTQCMQVVNETTAELGIAGVTSIMLDEGYHSTYTRCGLPAFERLF